MLLDTHVFLWLATDPDRLSVTLTTVLQQVETERCLSVLSGWELAIKIQKRKLHVSPDLLSFLKKEVEKQRLRVLPVSIPHLEHYAELPLHHADPFDRMLIAQAIAEDLTLVTSDREISKYRVKTILI